MTLILIYSRISTFINLLKYIKFYLYLALNQLKHLKTKTILELDRFININYVKFISKPFL